ncbi:unnamed protein product, partial [Scytosiphon promiscuus]
PLELTSAPADGPGASSGNPGDSSGDDSPKSSPLGQGPGLQAITLEAAESRKVPASQGGSMGVGGSGAGAVDSRGSSSSGGPKTWREAPSARDGTGAEGGSTSVGGGGSGGGSGGASASTGASKAAGGLVDGVTRELRSASASSSSDESMAGNARLSAPAMKKQWEEAMSGGNTPETPHRSTRGSASMDGSVGRGGGVAAASLLSPSAARELGSTFGGADGVVTRAGRAGSVTGVGGGGGGGGGGSSGSFG